jgi:predicted CopG family antitoxin
MGTKNISISDEAYTRLASQKKPKESFTDVVNRLTGRRSVLELRGLLSKKEGRNMLREIEEMRSRSRRRLSANTKKMIQSRKR